MVRSPAPSAGASLLALASQLGEQQLRVQRADLLAQRRGAGGDDLDRAVLLDGPGEAAEQHAHLLLDERRERLAVADRVVDGEADRLVVAARAEARDRRDDLHVVGVVAAQRTGAAG